MIGKKISKIMALSKKDLDLKTFIEKLRSSGFVEAVKDAFKKVDEAEEVFNIVSDTGTKLSSTE